MTVSSTDCRTPEGITVGLIDSIMTACRVLRGRDMSSQATQQALQDLIEDSDMFWLLYQCPMRSHLTDGMDR